MVSNHIVRHQIWNKTRRNFNSKNFIKYKTEILKIFDDNIINSKRDKRNV